MAKLFYASVNRLFQMSDILPRLPSLEKRSILGGKMGTALYQLSIEHRVICDRILKAFQCNEVMSLTQLEDGVYNLAVYHVMR